MQHFQQKKDCARIPYYLTFRCEETLILYNVRKSCKTIWINCIVRQHWNEPTDNGWENTILMERRLPAGVFENYWNSFLSDTSEKVE